MLWCIVGTSTPAPSARVKVDGAVLPGSKGDAQLASKSTALATTRRVLASIDDGGTACVMRPSVCAATHASIADSAAPGSAAKSTRRMPAP